MASRRRLLAIGMAGALVFAGPATTLAAATLDQQVTTSNDAQTTQLGVTEAQVFTAGITGNLEQIDVLVTTGPGPGKPSKDLTVTLWTVAAGAPDSPIDGTSRVVAAADVPNGAATWVHVPMNAHSVAGTQYAIVLSSDAPFGECPEVCWWWHADSSNPYGGGLSYHILSGASWVAQARDFDFKTWVNPTHTLQVYLSGVGEGANGSVSSADQAIDCGSICLATYAEGGTVTLTAHPAVTATFGYWQGGPCDQSHDPICTFHMPSQDVETNATFYGIEPTQPPGPTATAGASHAATPRPSATASNGASPAASIDASGEPSVGPLESGLASLEPGATPGPSSTPTTIPGEPTSDGGGSILPILLGIVLLAALIGGGGYFMGRRRQPGAPPPQAEPPPEA